MALLEVHDTVDITDFSQVTRLNRVLKEERKQEWAEMKSDFVSAGPRPEKAEPSALSDVKAATHSAYPEQRLREGQAQGREVDGGPSVHHPMFRHPLSIQQHITDKESNFTSNKSEVHGGGDAKLVKDDDEQTVQWEPSSSYAATDAGAEWDYSEDASPQKAKKVKTPCIDGGSGSNINGWLADVEKADVVEKEVEEDQVVAQNDGAFGHGSNNKNAASEKSKVMEREVKQVETRNDGRSRDLDATLAGFMEMLKAKKVKGRTEGNSTTDIIADIARLKEEINEMLEDDGGLTLRSIEKDAGLEKARLKREVKEVPERDEGGVILRSQARVKMLEEQMEARKVREAKSAKKVETRGDGVFGDQAIFPLSASAAWDYGGFGCSKTSSASSSSS
jgi:hypothetical protein